MEDPNTKTILMLKATKSIKNDGAVVVDKGPSIINVTHFLRFLTPPFPLVTHFTKQAYGVTSPFGRSLLTSKWVTSFMDGHLLFVHISPSLQSLKKTSSMFFFFCAEFVQHPILVAKVISQQQFVKGAKVIFFFLQLDPLEQNFYYFSTII